MPPSTTTTTNYDEMNATILSETTKPQHQQQTSNNLSEKDDADETRPTFREKVIQFYEANEFLLLIIFAIVLAKIYPPLGAKYLVPDISADWIMVMFIFLLAGLALKTEEFEAAFNQVYFNLFVQGFNFFVVSLVAYALSFVLVRAHVLDQSLADGMIICACLPMAINMVIILSKNADGDEAAAVFNSAVGNLVGIFLSPILILGYLGVSSEDVNLVDVFWKLVLRVVVPLAIGQIVQKTSTEIKRFMKQSSHDIKKAQIYALVFIVYTVFCTTFLEGNAVGIANILLMILCQFLLLVIVTVVSWYSLKVFFPDAPRQRVMGLFGCTHKTVSVGVPLINAMYDGNSNVGLYTLPLLVWHPLQLVFGSLLVPHLYDFVQRENKRLGRVDVKQLDDDDAASQYSWFY